jgi:FAD synthase
MALLAHLGLWPLIQFRNHFSQTVGLSGRVISSSQGFYLNTVKHKHRINAYTHQTSMSYVGFEPTIPASERAKKVHALDRAAAVTVHELILELLH